MCDSEFPFLWDFDWHKTKLDIKSQQMFEIKKKSHFDFIPRHIFKQFCLKYEIAVQSQN